MRLIFAGTPQAAVPSLTALLAGPHDIVRVVTRSDAPRGRKRVLTPSPVAAAAEAAGIPVLKSDRLDAEATATLTADAPELGVIVAYGGLVREPLLSMPARGWINLHFSLLPAWRGAAPVQRALIAGDTVTGASVFQLVPELDAGDVFAERRYEIPPLADAGFVLSELAEQGAALLAEVIDDIAAGRAQAHPQQGTPSYAHKLDASDGRLDWSLPATAVLARIRGTTPEPGAYTSVNGVRVKILAAHRADSLGILAPGVLTLSGRELLIGTGDVPLALDRVQPAGKGAMAGADWWRGLRVEHAQAELITHDEALR